MPWSEAQPLQAPLPEKKKEERLSLKELEQKSRITERLREIDQELAQQKVQETPVIGAGSEGFFLRSADRAFELRLRGTLQLDARFFFDNSNNATLSNPDLEIRRARPIIEGILFRYFDFRFMPDFGQGQTVLPVDGYLGFNYWPQFRIRAGKFKPPVGLERQQSVQDVLFMERGLPANLLPGRETGIQLYGDVLAKHLTYQVGIFYSARDNTNVTEFFQNNGTDFAARIFAFPFLNHSADWLKGLGIGIGGSYGSLKGQLSNFRIPSGGTGVISFFTYRKGVTAAGDRFRISPQLYYAWGPFGLLGEYAYNSQEVQQETTLDALDHRAWQLAASYVLTGENASFKGVKPRQDFNPAQGAWGALELKARYNELHVDSSAFPIFADPTRSAHNVQAWAVGINWYPTPNIKTMLDYEEGYFKGGAVSGDRATERVLMTRLQLAF
ncbi:MAG: OprO/OprP family phosphate-selective porin [Candidatus Nitrosoglobus sp.]